MFEKEAKEYAEINKPFLNRYDCICVFKDGAEFGYNKANDKVITEAKEIINTFLGFAEVFGYSPSMDKFISEAKQFLKENK